MRSLLPLDHVPALPHGRGGFNKSVRTRTHVVNNMYVLDRMTQNITTTGGRRYAAAGVGRDGVAGDAGHTVI